MDRYSDLPLTVYAFHGSSIMSDTHIQICVRDPAKSVVAYFRPRLAF